MSLSLCVWKACARSSFQRAVHEWESDGTIDHVLPYVICTRRLLPGRLAASNSVMNMSSCARRRRCRQLACPVGLVHGKAVPACWIGSTSHTFWLHGESINTVLLRFSSCNGNGTQGRSFLWCCTTATKLQPRSIIIPGTRTTVPIINLSRRDYVNYIMIQQSRPHARSFNLILKNPCTFFVTSAHNPEKLMFYIDK